MRNNAMCVNWTKNNFVVENKKSSEKPRGFYSF